MDWRREGACNDEDPELFFPVGNKARAAQDQLQRAKAVCVRCTVTADCLAWALASRQDAGVWGGMSEEERRELRDRQAKRARQVTAAASQ